MIYSDLYLILFGFGIASFAIPFITMSAVPEINGAYMEKYETL